jgi:hypothetical protein
MKPLAKATPEMARGVWDAQRRPSLRRVAHALTVGGHPVSHTTVARWKLQNWRPVKSDHPLEVARGQLDAVAPLVSRNPETTVADLLDDPAHQRDLGEATDAEILRRAAREVAVATKLVAKEIQKRSTTAFNMAEITPALLSVANCLTALPGAFDQAISLDAADQRPGFRVRQPSEDKPSSHCSRRPFKGNSMTIPDSPMGLDPGLFACRMEKDLESEAHCSFCGRPSPKVPKLIKAIEAEKGVCNVCLDMLLAMISDFYANSAGGSDGTCLFCERRSLEVHQMVKLDITCPPICSDCVVECLVTLRQYEDALVEAGMTDRWDMGGVTPWD